MVYDIRRDICCRCSYPFDDFGVESRLTYLHPIRFVYVLNVCYTRFDFCSWCFPQFNFVRVVTHDLIFVLDFCTRIYRYARFDLYTWFYPRFDLCTWIYTIWLYVLLHTIWFCVVSTIWSLYVLHTIDYCTCLHTLYCTCRHTRLSMYVLLHTDIVCVFHTRFEFCTCWYPRFDFVRVTNDWLMYVFAHVILHVVSHTIWFMYVFSHTIWSLYELILTI